MQLTNLFTPSWCRWNVNNPPKFTIWHNILYAFAGGFFSANLYYSHPILEVMAQSFNTTQIGVANIPTLAQAGDATGILLILPLADFFPRRRFSLVLLTLTACFWIGLCITNSLTIFQLLTYLSAVCTGIIQILIVLVAELSAPEERAVNISIVAAGPTFGILLARILSGIVANYTAWRNVYWLSLGLQIVMLVLMWAFMPDYPATNPTTPKKVIKGYPAMLYEIIRLAFWKHPVLLQASLLSFLTFICVSSYWTTLTFLLSEPTYNYSTLAIGLFGLIGASTMALGPVFAKFIIKPIGIPLVSAAIGVTTSLIGIVLGTFLGNPSVGQIAGPVIQALLLDAGLMMLQVSSRMAIHNCEPKAMNRVNTAFVSWLYLGMLTGTKTGNEVYARYGGWVPAGALSTGVIAFSYVVIVARGPNVQAQQWFGWSGGWGRAAKNTPKFDEEAMSNGDVNSDSIKEEKEKETDTDVIAGKLAAVDELDLKGTLRSQGLESAAARKEQQS